MKPEFTTSEFGELKRDKQRNAFHVLLVVRSQNMEHLVKNALLVLTAQKGSNASDVHKTHSLTRYSSIKEACHIRAFLFTWPQPDFRS